MYIRQQSIQYSLFYVVSANGLSKAFRTCAISIAVGRIERF